jgi:endo-1,4-beta-xylanase
MREWCRPLRRLVLLPIVGVLALAAINCGDDSTPTTPTPVAPAPIVLGDPLKSAASATGRLVGAAVTSSLLGVGAYRDIINREFSDVTAEYEMKWAAIERTRGVPSYAGGDAIVAHAQSQGMQVKGHALIWHQALPDWVQTLSAEELRTEFEAHIRSVAAYYRGRVRAWDVVNEAVADDGSGLRDTVFRQKLGDGYIADAFRIAREADPVAKLYYNDYGGEGMSSKSNRIYELLRNLRSQGVPIDGVGLQMHVSAGNRPSDASIAANMQRLAELGLQIDISEMDVRIASVAGSTQARLEAQRTTYQSIVGLCVREPACRAVTFWGVSDAHSWITGDDPLLFDRQYAPKPAYAGVLEGLRGR